ncbi:MAG: tryptophan synthase subunit alpha [Candidatus Scalindua sp. SCAELEC01]|nr:tryptophan synthase subunit alpha [Planctomycetota bacterium]RZV91379.1 MAG: tryptophan synthase subunit alpha [Candidatus Scalindua sp. SCAELEC01]
MNRIDKKFQQLKERGETAFIPFITAGDPSIEITKSLILDFENRGADLIELGFPFSDPIADGPVIQSSYFRALEGGVKTDDILEMVKGIRKTSEIPIVCMISHSILYKHGCGKFLERAADAGIDGATIPDLPIEEAESIIAIANQVGFKVVCFIAPTTTDSRMKIIVEKSQGFLYYISVVGITGERNTLSDDLAVNIKKIKSRTDLPVALGFGISTPEQARVAGQIADGVIVGSAIMREIDKYAEGEGKLLVDSVGRFLGEFIESSKGRI